ncbi:glycosyltransferase family 4 protein [Nocardia vulneris]|uniref:Glycosyltransferase subfamily 4-like N-terminal domain-containing protein n=1 Tax=Nocardia vulneris TaxID=1141657 RepID=A0ABR4Z7P1_9NOCA|nr:glycosyltransferase family 4 protein [Nocardia vulneris]KIA61368.1 hypothetical protein FG87_31210 [Nocardia vulneris]
MNVPSPNLLFLLDSPNIERGYALAGTPARVLALAEHTRRSGAQVTLALCDRGNDYWTASDWPIDVVLVHPHDYYDPAVLAGAIGVEVDVVVVCEAQALLVVGRPLADRLHARLLYDVHDDDAALAHSLQEPLGEIARLARVQRRAFDVSDFVIACAERELILALRADVPPERVELVPNGAEPSSYWGPSWNSQRLVFVGNLFYRPNQLAIEHLRDRVRPRLRELCPQARVQVIGRGPAALTRDEAGLEFLGPAPSIEMALRDATLGLAPLTAGAGSKMKVLDYMAAGLPVLATTEAVAGLPPAHPGVVVDDDLDRWAMRIASLMKDPMLLDDLGLAGRGTVEDELSWHQIAAELVHRCRIWLPMPARDLALTEPGRIAAPRWRSEHAAQGALGTPRHTEPGRAVHMSSVPAWSGRR